MADTTLTPQQVAEQKLDAIIAEVRRLAAERPDYKYQAPSHYDLDPTFYGVEDASKLNACLYIEKPLDSDEAVPSCMFGHAFLGTGYSVHDIVKSDNDSYVSQDGEYLSPDLDLTGPEVLR